MEMKMVLKYNFQPASSAVVPRLVSVSVAECRSGEVNLLSTNSQDEWTCAPTGERLNPVKKHSTSDLKKKFRFIV
jgi:hypothetical protein